MLFMEIVEDFGLHHGLEFNFILHDIYRYELSWPYTSDRQCSIVVHCTGPNRSQSVILEVKPRPFCYPAPYSTYTHFADILPEDDPRTVRQILEDARFACSLVASLIQQNGQVDPHDLDLSLDSENALCRYVAASLLLSSTAQDVIPMISKHLHHPDPVVRAHVAHVLMSAGDEENRRAAAALSTDPDPYVRGVIPSYPS